MFNPTEVSFKSENYGSTNKSFSLAPIGAMSDVVFLDQIIVEPFLQEIINSNTEIGEIRDQINLVYGSTTDLKENIKQERQNISSALKNTQEPEENDPSSDKLSLHLKSLYQSIIEQKLINDPTRINNFTVLTNNDNEEDLKIDFCSKVDELFTNQQKKILATFVKKIGQPILLDDSSNVLERIKELNHIDNDLKTIVGIPIRDDAENIGVVLILELSNDEKLTLNEIRALNNFFKEHAPEINQLKKATSLKQNNIENIEITAQDLADCLFRNSSNHVLRNILNPCYGWLSESPELEAELSEIKNGLDDFEQSDKPLGFFHKDSYLNKLLTKELSDIQNNPNNEFLNYLKREFSTTGKYTEYFNKMKKSVLAFKEKFAHFKNDENIYLYLANDQVQDKRIIAELNESIQKIHTIITESPQKIHNLLNNGTIPLTTIGASPYIPFDEVVSITDQNAIISNINDLLNNNTK